MSISIKFTEFAKLAASNSGKSNHSEVKLVVVENELNGHSFLTIDGQRAIEMTYSYSSAGDRARVIRELNSSLEAVTAGFARGLKS